MKAYLLLSITLSCCCSAEGAPLDGHSSGMVAAIAVPPPVLSDPNAAPQQEADMLDLLKQLVLVQKGVANGQVQVLQKLSVFEKQGSQLILDLQNMARHQSLLVENHQALLLQASRIGGLLQDMNKKPAESTSQ